MPTSRNRKSIRFAAKRIQKAARARRREMKAVELLTPTSAFDTWNPRDSARAKKLRQQMEG
jgi:hypothetical protein